MLRKKKEIKVRKVFVCKSLSKIISFNVGHGDCILLQFENEKQPEEKYFLLVDFGVKTKDKTNGQCQLDLINSIGKKITDVVKDSNIDILITHYHQDHYNGVYLSNELQKLEIKKMFVCCQKIPSKLNDFIIEKRIKLIYLKKHYNFKIHTYSNGNTELINILWPNTVISDLPSREEFLKRHCQNWVAINQVEPSPGQVYEHHVCLVFEVEGKNNKWCLFTEDSLDNINAYITNNEYIDNPDSRYYFFEKFSHQYSFIKAPHHGTESWPLKFAAKNCKVLITMADTQDNNPVLKEYFQNNNVRKVHMMNCAKCNLNCEKCTLTLNKVQDVQTICL